ncbi:MAG: tetratricopeptide repeat protein [Nitrospirota bacterium]|nr:tetratricopeptide repeat protein [Nitrospirota bacterium]
MNPFSFLYTWSHSCLPALLVSLVVTGSPQVTRGETNSPSTPSNETSSLGQLGTIAFPTSGSAEAQPHFLRGVAALHSFWYEEAIEAFRRSTAIDPNFAMGYWGEAMAHQHPVWKEENMDAGRTALGKIRSEANLTAREQRYLQAARTLFSAEDKLV